MTQTIRRLAIPITLEIIGIGILAITIPQTIREIVVDPRSLLYFFVAAVDLFAIMNLRSKAYIEAHSVSVMIVGAVVMGIGIAALAFVLIAPVDVVPSAMPNIEMGVPVSLIFAGFLTMFAPMHIVLAANMAQFVQSVIRKSR